MFQVRDFLELSPEHRTVRRELLLFDTRGILIHFLHFQRKDSSGLRGEGIALSTFPYPRGFLTVGNSGSGGNGRFSGGGGGSNAGSGGKGGNESNVCSQPGTIGGNGGTSLFPVFYTNAGEYANRIYMGGGGGTSTQNIPDGKASNIWWQWWRNYYFFSKSC
jgi:hypothetical protein